MNNPSYALILNPVISQMHIYMDASVLCAGENHITRDDDHDAVYIYVNDNIIKIGKDRIEKASSHKDFIWIAFFLNGTRIVKTDIIGMAKQTLTA